MLTKTESTHKARVVVVMLKESDLMSHTVIGTEAFGCFCQRAERCDWAGVCSEKLGSWPQEHRVKGEVSSWKYRAWDRKGTGLAAWDAGAWEISVTEQPKRSFVGSNRLTHCVFFFKKI